MKKLKIDVNGLGISFESSELLNDQKVGQSHSQLWRLNDEFGWALLEEGKLRYMQPFAQVYTEMMAHCALLAHPYPLDVLLIGAADGLMLRQVLKHTPVRRIDWVINQPATFEIAKTTFAVQELLEDPRVNLVIDFPLDFLRSAPKPYDLMISDTGFGFNDRLLQTHDYYQALSGLLKSGGVAVFSCIDEGKKGSKSSNDSMLVKEHFAMSGQAAFPDAGGLGGLQHWVWAGHLDMSQVDVDVINARLKISPMDFLYYSPLRHQIAFTQNAFISNEDKKLVSEFALQSSNQ